MLIGGKNSESTKQEVRGFPSGSVVKNPPAIREPQEPWVRRSPGRGHGDPLQNPMDRAAWQATVHRVAKSQTGLKRLSTAQGKVIT